MRVLRKTTWRELQVVLPKLTESDLLKMLQSEVRKPNARRMLVIRLHQRYTMLRAKRERQELLKK